MVDVWPLIINRNRYCKNCISKSDKW